MTIQTIQQGDLAFHFLKSGDISSIEYKNLMINQLVANPIDGSLNNIYLRLYKNDGMIVQPLLGVHSNSDVYYTDQNISWKGSIEGVNYHVSFKLHKEGIWFWEVNVEGSGVDLDLVYGQDVGIADQGMVRNNEAYLSQYIDHSVYEDSDFGYVVCSRQNLAQSTGFPYLQQGSLTKTVRYSTDGYQFFGLSYKETNIPSIYTMDLPNEIYQYEFAYTGLQSEKIHLDGSKQFVFYGMFSEDHPESVQKLEYKEAVQSAWKELKDATLGESTKINALKYNDQFSGVLVTESLTMDQIEALYPNRKHEEWDGNELLSFFTDRHEHIVLKEKEVVVERPHGHILMTGNNDHINEQTITTTTFMYGVFNSQLVIGNTNFNKMLSNTRNPLNYLKTSGQRIYVEIEGTYYLLAMPSVYEIGLNYTRWYYKTKGETFVVTTYTTVDTPEVHLHVMAESGQNYRYLVTNQITMNTSEYNVPFEWEQIENYLKITSDRASDNASIYPNLAYFMTVEGADYHLSDHHSLVDHASAEDASLLMLNIDPSSNWHMTIQGSLTGEKLATVKNDFEQEVIKYRDYYASLMNGFQLSIDDREYAEEIDRFNTLSWWYTHNMLVHYSVPHGLEQYSGAAWGTRDVCQGPVEYFLATEKYEQVKDILLKVYSHQFADDGNWPQWFMFDKYSHIKAGESHGDIIVWPLKALADYLEITNDYSILEEEVPYTRRDNHQFTEEKEKVISHVKKQIQYIEDNFIEGTFLSSYGDGDWNDTLQPANQSLKEFMVSSWTVALTYQTFDKFSSVIELYEENLAHEVKELMTGIKNDYHKYILSSDVVPGFVYMEDKENVELMLHPEDEKTGIHYRLLPMQRNMISELFNKDQVEKHYEIIQENLSCPDGIRLMNRPAQYKGGVNTHFQRAETAANFGREVGLHYIHAHIRFIEAMAKIGKADDVWNALSVINPISIQDIVPNAERRQANTYFSSSDGKFNTRYEAQENFDRLRDGSVQVKGGWRIYSSGPGIYMNQLISNTLGIRRKAGGLIIDPVLPDHLNGLKLTYSINERPVNFVYHLNESDRKIIINGKRIEGEELKNPYREGGIFIQKEHLESVLNKENNLIEIFV